MGIPGLISRPAGLAIAVLALVPLWRFLPSRETGLSGQGVTAAVETQTSLLWASFLLVAGLGLAAGLLLPAGASGRIADRIDTAFRRPTTALAALGTGLVSFVVTAGVTLWVFNVRPNLVDALAQLTHARFLAEGSLGAPADLPVAFFHLQNTVLSESGWYSLYAPGHPVLLGAALALGALWLLPPLLMAGTASLATLTLERLLPDRLALARIGGLLIGLSPMLVAQAATFMNHASAAFFAILAVYLAVRARDGYAGWALGAGAAVAAMAAIRPLSAIVVMVVVAGFVWLGDGDLRSAGTWRRVIARWGLAGLGGLPPLVLHLAYNRVAFGGPLAFGYIAAWGDRHGLGFHSDPYGNVYGPVEAVLYTSADLATLNLNLLEIPIPAAALIGLYLALRRGVLPAGVRVLTAWALFALMANFGYWHHGHFMGPRMLAESVPAWIALAVVATAWIWRATPDTIPGQVRFSPRGAVTATVALGVVGGAYLGASRLASYGGGWMQSFRMELPAVEGEALVLMSAPWESRLSARLTALGMSAIDVETAIRQNPICLVEQWTSARERGEPTAVQLDMERRSFSWDARVEVGPDLRVRADPNAPFPPECVHQAFADRFGGLDPSLFFWLGDLPGIETGRPMFARDLGPERNRELIDRYPDRDVWLWGPTDDTGRLRLVRYAEAMAIRWPTALTAPAPDGG